MDKKIKSKANIAKEYGVPASTLSTWIKNGQCLRQSEGITYNSTTDRSGYNSRSERATQWTVAGEWLWRWKISPTPCPSHADMIAMCSQMTTYLESQRCMHKYFSYVNSLQQFATNMHFNSNHMSTIFSFNVINFLCLLIKHIHVHDMSCYVTRTNV